jgi:hypothetical protein
MNQSKHAESFRDLLVYEKGQIRFREEESACFVSEDHGSSFTDH